jgi:AcrR family transcriptional regulator
MKSNRPVNVRKKPVQERSRETVDVILEAAAQVFSDQGFGGATTNRIAERAGVSVGTLYQYFPNKDAILYSLMEHHVREGRSLIAREAADLRNIGRLDRSVIKRLVEVMIVLHKNDPKLHRVLFEEVHYPHFWKEYRENEEISVRTLTALLEKTDRNRKKNIEAAIRLLTHAIEAMTHRFVLYGYQDLREEEFTGELTDMMSRYLLDEETPADNC